PVVIPAPVGRDKPGLTKKKRKDLRAPGAPRRGSPLLWGRLYAGQRRRARAPVVIPPPSAGINPAPQKRKDLRAPGAPRRGSPLLWGRLYAGQRRRARAPVVIPAPVGRDKPGPTKPASQPANQRHKNKPAAAGILAARSADYASFLRTGAARDGGQSWRSTTGYKG